MTNSKLKNTDKNDIKPTVICECHCHQPEMKCRLGKHCEYYGKKCSHCNPEKQGDWESRFDEEIYIPHEPDCSQTILLKSRDCDCGMDRHEGEIKQFIRQVEKQTRESVIDEVRSYQIQIEVNGELRNIVPTMILDELKQKTKE